MRKTMIRLFTIADYEDEELWLRKQHQNGWRLVRVIVPCFFIFESCTPQDVIYRVDYKNGGQTEEYMQMVQDFGWEYFAKKVGWLYFRKPANAADAEGEDELFSDSGSRLQMVRHIVRTRILPITLIFLFGLLPNLSNAINGKMGGYSGFFGAFFGVMFVFYVYLIIHCWTKLNAIKNKYQE